MIQALLGRKINQTQKFLENGSRVPVTEIDVPDNVVLQVKTLEKDKYTALQLGFGNKKRVTQAIAGHLKKAGAEKNPEAIKEVRVENTSVGELPKAGDFLTVASVFTAGAFVNVTGTSKGKGFAGVVKRHNFRGGPKTHGQSDRHRAPGSIGQTTTPGRVYKGKKMAGHMGTDTVTVTNLTIAAVDEKNKKLYVLGLVPGYKNSIVTITVTGENKKFVPLLGFKGSEVPLSGMEEEVVEEATSGVATLENIEEQKEAEAPKEEAVVTEAVEEEKK